MTDGSITASGQVKVRGSQDAQGSASTSTLRDTQITHTSSGQATLTYGTASGKCDIIVAQDRTLNATTSETLDLYAGGLNDILGAAANFRKIKFIEIHVITGGDASGMKIGGAASQAWVCFFADTSDKVFVFPSGPPLMLGSPAGVAVGATTNNLKIENAGAVAVTYRLVIGGTSA